MPDLSSVLRRVLARRLAAADLEDPFLPSLLRWQTRLGGTGVAGAGVSGAGVAGSDPATSPLALGLLHRWVSRGVGDADGPRRYPWEIPVAAFQSASTLAAWRPWDTELRTADGERWARGFWLPAVLGDSLEWLEWLEAIGGPDAQEAVAEVLAAVRRRVDGDLAAQVAEHEPWSGTFALSVLTGRPRTLERFHPVLTALLMRYVVDANDSNGLVLGSRHPLWGVPLVGATAQLGRGIVAIGQGLELLGPIAAFLRERHRDDGGWGEEGQATDLLTTLAAASFLASIDPDFSPSSPFAAIADAPEAARGWSALDPRDGAFIAAEVARYVDAAALPFEARFRWPHVPRWLLDPHCGLPRFGAFQDLATLVASVPGLERTPFEVAFLDLANFGQWNKDFGQAAGDDVLRFFGEVLREIPDSRVIQDGGDEMLVVGAPGRARLVDDLRAHFDGSDGSGGWPRRFGERFPGKWCVAVRGAVAAGRGDELMAMRGRSGESIGPIKRRYGMEPPAEGVFLTAEEAKGLA